MEKELIKEIVLSGGRFDHKNKGEVHAICQNLGIWPLELKDLLTTTAAHGYITCENRKYWEPRLRGLSYIANELCSATPKVGIKEEVAS